MEYFAVYAPASEITDPECFVFASKEDAIKSLKANKDSRFKSFKNRSDALKFAKSGVNPNISRQESSSSILDSISILKSPPPSIEKQIPRNLEKSNYPAPKSQDLVKFRKEIEQNHVQKVFEMISTNPRYLVSSGDTPAILKEGPRYNALHVAAMNNHAKMAKLILQTVEQPQFIEMLHGFKNHPNIEIMCQNLLESYLNTPDKSRNETPLHFAAKNGAIDVIQVLLAYPLCKMKQNSEGLYPKDIVCERCKDASPELKKSIEELLNERFFVPVLRSIDGSIQPIIGEPFTTANMPKLNTDPLSPSLEIKAYAGPMSSEQAQSFKKRWKTPPRLIPSSNCGHNLSFSPKSHSISSPLHSPRVSKSMSEVISSTPKLKKKLCFEGVEDDDFESVYLSNFNKMNDKNGNHDFNVLNKHEEEEFQELYEDLWAEKKNQLNQEQEKALKSYRNPEPCIIETPLKHQNDSNSNHIRDNFNTSFESPGDSLLCNPPSSNLASGHITFLDESGSIYSSDNIQLSTSFKEKNIRLTDPNKGLEKIGRNLAQEYNVGWKEYWDFLESFLDIRSNQGLECFEKFLKVRDDKAKESKLNIKQQSSSPRRLNDSIGLSSICAGFYSLDLNDEIMERKENPKIPKNGLISPSLSRSPLMEMLSNMRQSSNDLPSLVNPYTCIEQSCRTFAKRVAGHLESESIQDQYSYEKTLLVEINKLNTSIDSYKRDSRFERINFQKVHSRYSYLLVCCLKKNNIDVKYLRNLVPLMSKVYALASTFTLPASRNLIKSHAMCISTFIRNYIERQEKIFDPENINTETDCVDAWNGPDIIECKCSFEMNFISNKQKISHRRDIRKRLYSGSNNAKKVDVWSMRNPSEDFDDENEEEETFLSCDSDLSSDEDEYFTPPQSPILQNPDSSDEEMNVFEESLEHFDDEIEYSLYINGDQPTKIDFDVLNAIGEDFIVDDTKYPYIHKWHRAMRNFDSLKIQNSQTRIQPQQSKPSHAAFRLFTPKLKI
ncbi:hypothetical protein PVAND_013988 [Polypedilum vanderplanki]|uniref:ANKLE2 third alpha/beta domain-containing protein n=1 Tax=Polypedilum vanderplanki TaxID=319348 RepID=A0A9J6CSD5_POLVA|nr:hypothetical protein PVAND_013988 [Polypedilum vanderplanki]